MTLPLARADMPFGRRRVGPDYPVLVVAEIGINHEGDAEQCLRLIEAAAASGADAVKLQTSDPDENYIPATPSYDLFKRAFLGPEATARAFACARALGLEPFTTTGMRTFEWIERLAPVAYKISSSTLGHFPLVRLVASTGRPVLLSTGMAEAPDVAASVDWARRNGAKHLAVMQCTSLYPCAPEQLDLAVIGSLAALYDCVAGFSDHSLGPEAAPLAVAAGARVIEKHFSLDTSRPSFDHALSLDPAGFAGMVRSIRAAERMLGSREKRLGAQAAVMAHNMKRYLVARRDLAAGAVLGTDDIGVMRLAEGADGLVPRHYDALIGSRLRAAVKQWSAIRLTDVEPRTGMTGNG